MLCLCRRGRKNLSHLRKSDFVLATDVTGAKFVAKVLDSLMKKVKITVKKASFEKY